LLLAEQWGLQKVIVSMMTTASLLMVTRRLHSPSVDKWFDILHWHIILVKNSNIGYDFSAVIKEAKAFKDKPILIEVSYPLQMGVLLHTWKNFKGKKLAF